MNLPFRVCVTLYSAFMNKVTIKNSWIGSHYGDKNIYFKHTPETLKIIREGGVFGGLGANSRTIRKLKRRKLFRVTKRKV